MGMAVVHIRAASTTSNWHNITCKSIDLAWPLAQTELNAISTSVSRFVGVIIYFKLSTSFSLLAEGDNVVKHAHMNKIPSQWKSLAVNLDVAKLGNRLPVCFWVIPEIAIGYLVNYPRDSRAAEHWPRMSIAGKIQHGRVYTCEPAALTNSSAQKFILREAFTVWLDFMSVCGALARLPQINYPHVSLPTPAR